MSRARSASPEPGDGARLSEGEQQRARRGSRAASDPGEVGQAVEDRLGLGDESPDELGRGDQLVDGAHALAGG